MPGCLKNGESGDAKAHCLLRTILSEESQHEGEPMAFLQRLLSCLVLIASIAGCSGGRAIAVHVPQETQEQDRMNLQALGYQNQADNLRELARANELEAIAISSQSAGNQAVAIRKRARATELRAEAEEADQRAEEAEHGIPS